MRQPLAFSRRLTRHRNRRRHIYLASLLMPPFTSGRRPTRWQEVSHKRRRPIHWSHFGLLKIRCASVLRKTTGRDTANNAIAATIATATGYECTSSRPIVDIIAVVVGVVMVVAVVVVVVFKTITLTYGFFLAKNSDVTLMAFRAQDTNGFTGSYYQCVEETNLSIV